MFAAVLLLLLCVDVSQNKPPDFICTVEARRSVFTRSLDALTVHSKTLLSQSVCEERLPSPVLCPCIRIHHGTWKQTPMLGRLSTGVGSSLHRCWVVSSLVLGHLKSGSSVLNITDSRRIHQFQQKKAFVQDSLDTLLGSLRSVKESLLSSCQTLILEKLEHIVKNHLLIVNALSGEHLERQIPTPPPEASCQGLKVVGLTETLEFYGRLVRGPVYRLLDSLEHMCHNTHDTLELRK